MPRTLISLGANLGNVAETIAYAQQLLRETFSDGDLRFSSLYRTPPVGGPAGQGDFINCVLALHSDCDVWNVWEGIKKIETQLGRHRLQRWEARRIDIDVLLHDDLRIWTPHFKVPHPRMCMRSFILVPAKEVAAQWVDPVSGWTVGALADHLSFTGPIAIAVPSADLERGLKEELRQADDLHQLDWYCCPKPEDLLQLDPLPEAKLWIAAISTPDPDTILWEDFSRPWAQTLRLAPGEFGDEAAPFLVGPRYLLPANNRSWAAHEILAAREAMRCPVERIRG
ncbi:2-amino-4-hydroxy-6-hydroxymethyldihydropteridine diphosphokinase [Pirellulaceae bacterium SH501]